MRKSNSEMVFVFYNSPNAIKFEIDEKIIVINGAPLSELYSPTGNIMTQGKFGITELCKDEWEAIQRKYGSMKIFSSSLIYAHKDKSYGKQKAKELIDQKNGNEQVKIASTHSIPNE